MAILQTVWKLDKVVMPSSVEFSQISSSRIDAGIESMLEYPAGHPHPMFRANLRQRPRVEFVTPELDVLLGAIGVGGASVGTNTDCFLKAGTQTGSTARASTAHTRLRIASSFAYWSQIRLTHNGKSEATVMVMPVYDGTNNPIVIAGGSVALSGNLGAGTFFGAGPLYINGTEVVGVQSITIDSGMKLIQAGDASNVWDTFIGVEQTAPSVTVQLLREYNWSGLTLPGTALNGSTGLVCYARKYSNNGTRVANATTQHISFTGLLGTAIPMDTNGQASSPITDTIKFELISSSDSVVPLTLSTSAAIP